MRLMPLNDSLERTRASRCVSCRLVSPWRLVWAAQTER